MKILLICNYKPGVGGISGQVEILQKHLREEGHIADIFSTKGSILWRLGVYCRLRNAAKSYDVLHIHCCSGWGFLPAVVGTSIGRRLNKRVTLTYHGGGAEGFFHNNKRLVSKYLHRTDTNIVLSGFLAKVFDKYDLPYTIIPNIIDLNGNLYRGRECLLPHYICTRTHDELYGIPCLLKAFQLVQQQLPSATLTLVGDGTQHEQLKQLTATLHLHNVTFTGRVANDDIYNYIDKADIMISSSTVDNMPVSLLEAMNAGLLVIATRVGGVPYMIDDGKTGLLFESGNHYELAMLMLRAVDTQDESMAMIKTAHAAVQTYQWGNVRQKLYAVYGITA